MNENSFISCYQNSTLILTEGAVGQRIEHEFGLMPDKDIKYSRLIYDSEGREALETIYRQYLQIAEDYGLPIILLTNTRRANKERVLRSSYKYDNVNYDYALFLRNIARDYSCKVFIGGMMGCKKDAYKGDKGLTINESIEFHSWQADLLANSPIDFLFAGIMPSKDEAIGMASVMQSTGLPYIISLMVNESGTLLDGNSIHDTINEIDNINENSPVCYMSNCIHPSVLRQALSMPCNETSLVRRRFGGIQANAANLALNLLDNSIDLITTDAKELVDGLELLHNQFPLKILGGCCGTDNTHINEIAKRFKQGVQNGFS